MQKRERFSLTRSISTCRCSLARRVHSGSAASAARALASVYAPRAALHRSVYLGGALGGVVLAHDGEEKVELLLADAAAARAVQLGKELLEPALVAGHGAGLPLGHAHARKREKEGEKRAEGGERERAAAVPL